MIEYNTSNNTVDIINIDAANIKVAKIIKNTDNTVVYIIMIGKVIGKIYKSSDDNIILYDIFESDDYNEGVISFAVALTECLQSNEIKVDKDDDLVNDILRSDDQEQKAFVGYLSLSKVLDL